MGHKWRRMPANKHRKVMGPENHSFITAVGNIDAGNGLSRNAKPVRRKTIEKQGIQSGHRLDISYKGEQVPSQ